jgi:hypothetical protein
MRPRPTYEPPYARDLSGMGALGKKGPKPMSSCEAGFTIRDTTCNQGDLVYGSGGSCNPAGHLRGQYPQCSAGVHGNRGCLSGNLP